MAGTVPQNATTAAAQTGYDATPPVLEKHVHRHKLAQILGEHTWWLCTTPCCCGGWGFAPVRDPVLLGHSKMLCLEDIFQTEWATSGDMGFCMTLEKCCCIVSHSSCPPGGGPNDGVPLFACCNRRWGGESGTDVMIQEDAQLMKDTFLLYYCGCCGCGVAHVADPVCKGLEKCLCLRRSYYTADPFPSDRDCCYLHAKWCCCIEANTFPPLGGKADGIPACALCGRVLFGAPATAPEQQRIVPAAVPVQQPMA